VGRYYACMHVGLLMICTAHKAHELPILSRRHGQ
jgi:hypothetical protein